jgi:Rod binding domain-containing protein
MNLTNLASFINLTQPAPAAPNGGAGATSHAPNVAKIKKAAREFESVLLNSLLGPLQKSFSTLPGGKPEDPESGQYHSMEIQSLANALSSAGGLGIADMIVRNLLRSNAGEGLKASNVLSPLADVKDVTHLPVRPGELGR